METHNFFVIQNLVRSWLESSSILVRNRIKLFNAFYVSFLRWTLIHADTCPHISASFPSLLTDSHGHPLEGHMRACDARPRRFRRLVYAKTSMVPGVNQLKRCGKRLSFFKLEMPISFWREVPRRPELPDGPKTAQISKGDMLKSRLSISISENEALSVWTGIQPADFEDFVFFSPTSKFHICLWTMQRHLVWRTQLPAQRNRGTRTDVPPAPVARCRNYLTGRIDQGRKEPILHPG